MARPLLIDGKLPMHIFTNHGYRYAVTRTSVRKENGSYNHPQKIWGIIDEGLNFHPNARFLALSDEEKKGILIPSDWTVCPPDTTETPRRGRPPYTGGCSCLMYGHTWFLDMLAEKSGLRDDLVHVFEDSKVTDQILTMAYYSLVGTGPYSHLPSEQTVAWFPAASPLEPFDITRLTMSITEDNRHAMFRCRRGRADSDSWLGVDSTSITHYGRELSDAKRGKNKEHDPADQVNLLVIYDLSDGAPVYYRRMPGNIPDTRTMRVTLSELQNDGFGNVKLVFDRGYVSMEVLTLLVKQRHPFVMMAKANDSQVAKAIETAKYEEMATIQNWIDAHGVYGKVLDYNFKVKVKNEIREMKTMKLCLFFDPEIQGERRKEVMVQATEMGRQLENMRCDSDILDEATLERFSTYYDLKLTFAGSIRSYSINEQKVDREVAKAGYFAIITNCMSPSRHDLSEILEIYAMRDEQEKSFMFIKSEQEGRRLRTSKEKSVDGRLFIQFVALILNCMIYRIYNASKELQRLFRTRRHMLEELRSIKLIQHPHRQKIVTEIVGSQVDVFKEFHLPVPFTLLPKDRRAEYQKVLHPGQ